MNRNDNKQQDSWTMPRRVFVASALAAGTITAFGVKRVDATTVAALPGLTFPINELEPVISERTLSFHHGKHHKAYVDTLNKLVEGTGYTEMSLAQIVTTARTRPADTPIFNNAAQAWNHAFYWKCLAPVGSATDVPELLARAMAHNFGSTHACKQAIVDAALKQFGNGWVWLIARPDGTLAVMTTANAETPLGQANLTPILTIDLWEHAYYLDWQNRRGDHVASVLDLVTNWNFASANYADVLGVKDST